MTVFIADISGFQAGINLGLLKAQGYAGVIIKCTEGAGYFNGDYNRARAQAKAIGLDAGAYHFLHARNIAAQARNLAQHIGDKTIPAHIDMEPTGSSRPSAADLHQFIEACRSYGLTVVSQYVPPWYHASIGYPTLPNIPLWVSRYGANRSGYASVLYPGDKAASWLGYGGIKRATLLQFSSADKIDNYPRALDVSAFAGTLTQLRQTGLLKAWTLPPPPPPVIPPPVIPPPEVDVPLSDADVQKVAAAVVPAVVEQVVQAILHAPLGRATLADGRTPVNLGMAEEASWVFTQAQIAAAKAAASVGGAQ